jgi:hypothetical protein
VWSTETATKIGIASDKALEFAGVFGNMLKPMGFATDKAAAMSTRLVDLAADMASFNNASPEDTLKALQSGLAGQVRPLRQFGVFLDQARIKQEALNLGLYSGKGNLDASAKAAASYAIILKDTKDAQGDFARTSDGLANQQRILKAQISDLEAKIGEALLPVVLKVTKQMNKWAESALHSKRLHDDLKEALHDAQAVIDTSRESWKKFSNVMGGNAKAIEAVGAAFATWKLSGTMLALQAAAGEAGAAGSVGLLTTRLKALSLINPIVIPIVLAVALKQAGQGDPLSLTALAKHGGSITDFLLGPKGHRGALGNLLTGKGGDTKSSGAVTGAAPQTGTKSAAKDQRAAIVATAQTQLGIAYQWGGPPILGSTPTVPVSRRRCSRRTASTSAAPPTSSGGRGSRR